VTQIGKNRQRGDMTMPADRMEKALITDPAALRAWLAAHWVEGMDGGRRDGTKLLEARPVTAGSRTSGRGAPAAFAAVLEDLVWQHDADGAHLPEHTLFALRNRVVPAQ
jgi:hypothetical protein